MCLREEDWRRGNTIATNSGRGSEGRWAIWGRRRKRAEEEQCYTRGRGRNRMLRNSTSGIYMWVCGFDQGWNVPPPRQYCWRRLSRGVWIPRLSGGWLRWLWRRRTWCGSAPRGTEWVRTLPSPSWRRDQTDSSSVPWCGVFSMVI